MDKLQESVTGKELVKQIGKDWDKPGDLSGILLYISALTYDIIESLSAQKSGYNSNVLSQIEDSFKKDVTTARLKAELDYGGSITKNELLLDWYKTLQGIVSDRILQLQNKSRFPPFPG